MSKSPTRGTGKREQQRTWQFKDQWIGQEAGSANYYRYWYKGKGAGRRVSRASLGTADLEAAKTKLVGIILGEAPEDPLAADQVYFSAVMRCYMDGHGSFIRSKNAAQRAFDLALAYLKKASGVASPRVSEFTLARQEAFMRWCRDEHKLSAKSIATYLAMIRAGMTFAAKPRIITDSKGREREARTLSAAPFIQTAEKEICKVTGLPRPAPREFIPTDAQLAAFLHATYDETDEQDAREREHIFRYCIIALNTWARPEAICELNVTAQVDFSNGIIDLNARGRAQNNKYRPTIRLTDNLRGWLLHWGKERPIAYMGHPVKEVLPKTFKKIGKRAGVPEMVRYSLRHYMNTRAMSVPADIRPDREERAIWMGHFDPRFRTTLVYEHRNPDHLVKCMKATDSILRMLDQLCGKSLFSPKSLPSSGLTVVENKGYLAG
jgi:integrase